MKGKTNTGVIISETESLEGGKHIGTQIDPMYCHKATVSELIEYFKKEGEIK